MLLNLCATESTPIFVTPSANKNWSLQLKNGNILNLQYFVRLRFWVYVRHRVSNILKFPLSIFVPIGSFVDNASE